MQSRLVGAITELAIEYKNMHASFFLNRSNLVSISWRRWSCSFSWFSSCADRGSRSRWTSSFAPATAASRRPRGSSKTPPRRPMAEGTKAAAWCRRRAVAPTDRPDPERSPSLGPTLHPPSPSPSPSPSPRLCLYQPLHRVSSPVPAEKMPQDLCKHPCGHHKHDGMPPAPHFPKCLLGIPSS